MHFHFVFSAAQILWTLTFAALLVLLVVLLGRDRARHYPWFTTSIALVTLLMAVSRLLFARRQPPVLNIIFLAATDAAAVVSLLVLVELARRGFKGAARRAWWAATAAVVAVGVAVLAVWGPWPAWKTFTAGSYMAAISATRMVADKGDILAGVLAIELWFLVIWFGRRFHAGWRSHTQGIVIGLSTAAISDLALRGIMQAVALHTIIHSRAEYDHIMALRNRLFNANSVVYLCVLVWWIACLWMDEPGAAADGGWRAPTEDRAQSSPSMATAGSTAPPAAESPSVSSLQMEHTSPEESGISSSWPEKM